MSTETADDSVWRMRKGKSVAEASVVTSGREREWQLSIDGEPVIGCVYHPDGGSDPANALARTARYELEARGWKATRG